DNLFGVTAARTHAEAAEEAGLITLASLANALPVRDLALDHLSTPVPAELEPFPGERPQDFYHRLMHAFRHPTVIAALNDLKAAYVEVANPLNIDTCVAVARSLPSALRDHKRLLNSMADDAVPFARVNAIGSFDVTLAPFVELLADELLGARTAQHFSRPLGALLADRLTRHVPTPRRRSRLERAVGRLVPQGVRRRVRASTKPPLSTRRLALRVYIANSAIAMLLRDAAEMAKLAPSADARPRSVSGRG